MSKPEITIAGAGLVGSLLAIYLSKHDYRVNIFEAREDMRRHDISAGRSINLALANRGIAPLKEVGVFEQVEPLLIPMKGRMIHDLEGNQSLQPYGQAEHEVIYSVSRAELNKILMDAAEAKGANIQFESPLEAIDFDTKQLTTNAKQSSFELLIGADGAGSPVRKALLDKVRQNQVTDIQDVQDILGHSYKELTIPASQSGNFQLDPNALHIWPRGGFMIIALPNPDKSFTVTLFMPNEGEVSFASINNEQQLLAFFEQYFKNLLPLIPDLTSAYFDNPTGLLGTVRCAPWYLEQSALLIGDAAHAIVPFHGQGMNCGFEDCMQLNQAIVEHNHNWSHVMPSYFEARKTNADAIADMALENYVEMRDSVTNPKFLLKKALGFKLQQALPEKFIPRYSMVMFNLMPYAEAKQRGVIQDSILEQLVAGVDDIEQIDMDKAVTFVTEQLNNI